MNGEQHYHRAEQLLALAGTTDPADFASRVADGAVIAPPANEAILAMLAAGRAHAELATAAMLADTLDLLRRKLLTDQERHDLARGLP